MKKILFIISLLLLTGWIAGVFIFKAPAFIHILLVVSAILYIRSLICRENGSAFAGNTK